MPPDQNVPAIAQDNTVRSKKIAWLLGGIGVLIVVLVIVFALFNRSTDVKPQTSEEDQPTPMVSGLTNEQMKQRDEMQARLDAIAREEGGDVAATPEEAQGRLDSIVLEGTSTAATTEEMQARLDALSTEELTN